MDNYYLFLDESGHHGLKSINQDFPVFLLCGCILEQTYFQKEFTPRLNELKEKYFGTKDVIFHSRDIRKWQNQFKVLGDLKLRNSFYKNLDNLVSRAKFTIIASAILKQDLIKQYGPRADNPYNLCLAFILERAIFFTDTIGGQSIKVIAEARGKREDAGLQNQYQLVLSNGTKFVTSKRFHKKTNPRRGLPIVFHDPIILYTPHLQFVKPQFSPVPSAPLPAIPNLC